MQPRRVVPGRDRILDGGPSTTGGSVSAKQKPKVPKDGLDGFGLDLILPSPRWLQQDLTDGAYR